MLALALLACEPEAAPIPRVSPPAERPPPPRVECAAGGPARAFEGTAPALAQNAVVVHGADGHGRLHRLDLPDAPIALPFRVLALRRRADGWLAALPERFVELDVDGEVVWELATDVEAVDAALATRPDEAWLVLRDGEDEISVRRIDLRTREADPPAAVGRGRGRLLVAPGRAGWAGPDGTVWSADGEVETPGRPVALVDEHVIWTAPDRTGLWTGDAVRATSPFSTPEGALGARVGDRLVIAYQTDGDLFVQSVDPAEGAVGIPALLAAGARADDVAASGARLWVAWARDAATVEVRAAECGGGGA